MARALTVMEPLRSLFYAPQFVALHGGHFPAEGRTRTRAGGSSCSTRSVTATGGSLREPCWHTGVVSAVNATVVL